MQAIEDVVTPLHAVPYEDQLAQKHAEIQQLMKRITRKLKQQVTKVLVEKGRGTSADVQAYMKAARVEPGATPPLVRVPLSDTDSRCLPLLSTCLLAWHHLHCGATHCLSSGGWVSQQVLLHSGRRCTGPGSDSSLLCGSRHSES